VARAAIVPWVAILLHRGRRDPGGDPVGCGSLPRSVLQLMRYEIEPQRSGAPVCLLSSCRLILVLLSYLPSLC